MKKRKASKPRRAARRAPARKSAARKSAPDAAAALLRHTVATLAYRAGKALRGAPPEYAAFCAAPGVRTPAQILAHMGDLFDWALSIARGAEKWNNSSPLPWDAEVARFFAALAAFDRYLASGQTLHASAERLFQGPIADALQHTGQLTLLRRAGGAPIRGENYSRADIVSGRVSSQQTPPRREFD
ncbi:MAG TPA: hypothetical protein VLW54_09285 [Candidatus Acidoferrales bacterium]|nr:hypothetical protein [Candidatus Acidoferrales bacterium]